MSPRNVLVVGASSGIGLATALAAATRGARVVLSSRNGPELERIVARIKASGGEAAHVVADVSRREDLQHLSDRAVELYGGYDTWVNNAGTGVFGRLEHVSDEDNRRIFDVNFWGVVTGTQIAADHLRSRGGAIINLGSIAADLAFPLQGMYCASKHAIKGFTDAFRMEAEAAGWPVVLTLIKPSAINTPFARHARNYLDEEPVLPPPLYQPEDVASAILHAAEHGGRDYYVGGGGKLLSSLNKRIPAAIDWIAARMAPLESSGPRTRSPDGSLFAPGPDGETRGSSPYPARRSLYTGAQTHPATTTALLAISLAGIALLAGLTRRA